MISSPDKLRGSFTWWEASCGQDKITTFQHFLHLFHLACTLPPATSEAQWCLAMIGCSKCAAISLDSDSLRHRAAHDPARSAPLPPPCHSADLRRHLVAGGRRLDSKKSWNPKMQRYDIKLISIPEMTLGPWKCRIGQVGHPYTDLCFPLPSILSSSSF